MKNAKVLYINHYANALSFGSRRKFAGRKLILWSVDLFMRAVHRVLVDAIRHEKVRMIKLTKAAGRCLAGILVAVAVATPVTAGEKTFPSGPDNVAIEGYDTVAYFTEAQATKGQPEFAFSWNDVQWYFANAAHRDMFASDPERYAPRFGGSCSMGLSKGKRVAANPEVWTIVDGKLYLYFSEGARDKFQQNTSENIKKAEANWGKAQ